MWVRSSVYYLSIDLLQDRSTNPTVLKAREVVAILGLIISYCLQSHHSITVKRVSRLTVILIIQVSLVVNLPAVHRFFLTASFLHVGLPLLNTACRDAERAGTVLTFDNDFMSNPRSRSRVARSQVTALSICHWCFWIQQLTLQEELAMVEALTVVRLMQDRRLLTWSSVFCFALTIRHDTTTIMSLLHPFYWLLCHCAHLIIIIALDAGALCLFLSSFWIDNCALSGKTNYYRPSVRRAGVSQSAVRPSGGPLERQPQQLQPQQSASNKTTGYINKKAHRLPCYDRSLCR